ncbi:MAG: carbohydrate ABC transporter permease [Christensenellales bacterium]
MAQNITSKIRRENKIRTTVGDKLVDILIYFLMTVFMFIALYPLYYCAMASFSDAKSILANTEPLLLPIKPYTIHGYQMAFKNVGIPIGFRNTVLYVILGTLGSLFVTMLGAFCVSRKYFFLRGFAMKMILVTMFFSGGIIPMFFVVRWIGIYNTPFSFVLPYLVSSYNLIIMRTFFLGIPDSLEEAALLDGANEVQIFFHVIIPLSTAVIAVIAMYYGVGYWNSWYPAMMFIRNKVFWPLQMFLREVLIEETDASVAQDVTSQSSEAFDRELVKYCMVMISTVPILVIYPFLQKYFVKGVMIGAIKG